MADIVTTSSDSADTVKPPVNDQEETQRVINSTALKIRERIFVQAYGDPTSPTFANATQSYRKAYPAASLETAQARGSTLLDRDRVAQSVTDVLNQAGLGIEFRTGTLKRLISHKDIGKVVSRVAHDENGALVTTTEQGPAYRDQLKALDMMNKMDGTYSKSDAQVRVAEREYAELRKRFFQGAKPKQRVVRDTSLEGAVACVESPTLHADSQDGTQQAPSVPQSPAAPSEAAGGGLGDPRGDCVSRVPEADKNSIGEGQ